MRLLNKKLHHLSTVLKYASSFPGEGYDIMLLSDAPFFVKLLSRGTYCAYNTTVYVPSTIHLELVQSKHEEDRTLATAKLLPFIMLFYDNTKVSFWLFLAMVFTTRYQVHYFIYEFLFLKYTEHPFKEIILVGFLTSRRNLLGFKLCFDTVQARIKSIFDANSDSISN